MKLLKKIYKILRKLFEINLLYSFYFNLRYLPLKKAVQLPIFIYPRTKIIIKKGAKININESDISFGTIKIGKSELLFNRKKEYSQIVNGGDLIIGTNVNVYSGINCTITKSGKLTLQNSTKLGANTKIVCCNEIIIGENSRIAFECQIFDTNFHYIKDLETNKTSSITKNVKINQFCWIGNRTTINQGTVLPSFTIVGSNSLLNKDYTISINENSIIAGQPAKLIKSGVQRIFDIKIETSLLNEDGLIW